jgi:hypothetical protein
MVDILEFEVLPGLISLLSEEELMNLMDVLGKFSHTITSNEKIKMGSFPGKDTSAVDIFRKIIKDIELELLKRKK